jgi:hypothetical protein
MPLQTTLPTWVALNAANDRSPSGFVDKRTKLPTYAGGLNLGDYFDLTEQEANEHSFAENGILHAGRYRRVQVLEGATAEFIAPGRVGCMPIAAIGDLNRTTSYDPDGNGLTRVRLVMFLNPVTPGNYCFIQEAGIANGFMATGAVTTVPIQLYAINARDGTVGTAGAQAVGWALETFTAPGFLRIFLNWNVPLGG